MDDLFLSHPTHGIAIDLTRAHLTAEAMDRLPWPRAFTDLHELEDGSVANPDEGRRVGHYWLRAPERAPEVALGEIIGDSREAVLSFVNDIQAGSICAPDGERFTDVIQIGIGGSALGPQLLVDALGDGSIAMHFVDNLDPDGIARTVGRIGSLRTTLVLVVSKSGGTAETAHGLTLIHRVLTHQGLDASGHLVAVTGDNSKLDRRAQEEGWLKRFVMWDWVGGRTSVTSAVGLLPGGLAGVDMRRLLEGAAMMDGWTRSARWRDNPAAMLAGSWHLLGQGAGDRNLVVLPYADRLLLFSRYLQQLIMESIGKKHDLDGNEVHQGLSVFGNKGSTDQHSFVQQLRDGRNDFIALLIQVLEDGAGDDVPVDGDANAGDVLQGFLLGTRRALHDGGRPTLTLTVPRVDAFVLGALIALFERAVSLYASLVNINAYHQPGVEAGKVAAKQILELRQQVANALGDAPTTIESLHDQTGADVHELWYLLRRLEATGRATHSREGWSRS